MIYAHSEYQYNYPVDSEVLNRLLELNRVFYQTFAEEFSATRRRLQPGVQRILRAIPAEASILDLGCGHGELWHSLEMIGHRGRYIGLDFSPGFLQLAQKSNAQATFLHLDLSTPDWDALVPEPPYDVSVAFAVLHHLPSQRLRLQVLHKVRQLVKAGGRFFHSEWQFLNSPRLRSRIQPWESIGLSPNQVEEGDFLLDWRKGGHGLRYVHHFSEEELFELAEKSGFRIVETFFSDGESGKLSIYQVWE